MLTRIYSNTKIIQTQSGFLSSFRRNCQFWHWKMWEIKKLLAFWYRILNKIHCEIFRRVCSFIFLLWDRSWMSGDRWEPRSTENMLVIHYDSVEKNYYRSWAIARRDSNSPLWPGHSDAWECIFLGLFCEKQWNFNVKEHHHLAGICG